MSATKGGKAGGDIYTLQGINISHLEKRKIIFQNAIFGGYVSSLEGNPLKKKAFFFLGKNVAVGGAIFVNSKW